jgi:hypothetical protein
MALKTRQLFIFLRGGAGKHENRKSYAYAPVRCAGWLYGCVLYAEW